MIQFTSTHLIILLNLFEKKSFFWITEEKLFGVLFLFGRCIINLKFRGKKKKKLHPDWLFSSVSRLATNQKDSENSSINMVKLTNYWLKWKKLLLKDSSDITVIKTFKITVNISKFERYFEKKCSIFWTFLKQQLLDDCCRLSVFQNQ